MTIGTTAVRSASARSENAPDAETTYRPRHPIDVPQTLSVLARGGDGPCFRRTPGGAWLTLRTPQGPATLRIVGSSGGRGDEVRARAWGSGAEWAIEGVPSLLGADDDWSGLDVSSSALLSEVRRRNPGLRLARTRRVFEMLVPSIIEQKITCTEAWASWRHLVRRHGEEAPGPAPAGMLVTPTADAWRGVPSWEWHRAGVGPDRSKAVVRAGRVADALERTAGMAAHTASARLQTIPGVGVWTAAEVTARSHGNADAVSVGDFGLAATVGCALVGEPVDDDAMLELLRPWAGQRQRVLRLIAQSGIGKPRRGPRLTRQDHRWH